MTAAPRNSATHSLALPAARVSATGLGRPRACLRPRRIGGLAKRRLLACRGGRSRAGVGGSPGGGSDRDAAGSSQLPRGGQPGPPRAVVGDPCRGGEIGHGLPPARWQHPRVRRSIRCSASARRSYQGVGCAGGRPFGQCRCPDRVCRADMALVPDGDAGARLVATVLHADLCRRRRARPGDVPPCGARLRPQSDTSPYRGVRDDGWALRDAEPRCAPRWSRAQACWFPGAGTFNSSSRWSRERALASRPSRFRPRAGRSLGWARCWRLRWRSPSGMAAGCDEPWSDTPQPGLSLVPRCSADCLRLRFWCTTRSASGCSPRAIGTAPSSGRRHSTNGPQHPSPGSVRTESWCSTRRTAPPSPSRTMSTSRSEPIPDWSGSLFWDLWLSR